MDPAKPPEPTLTMESVRRLIDRSQELVDARPPGEHPVDWCVEAAFIGDIAALGAVAAIASRATADSR